MELDGMKALVVGFGKTGKAVTRFLLDRGVTVTVNDNKPSERFGEEMVLLKEGGAEFVLGDHPLEVFLLPDFIVVSPGVDPSILPLTSARKKGIPIISEIELAARFITTPVIGITGTNGKTTTTALIATILRHSGFSIFTGGNIGNPLINFVQEERKADFLVVELSSFQLEGVEEFSSHIGILLNITEDHLDRYASFDHYCQTKYRVFMNQTPHDVAILNRDDAACRSIAPSLFARVLPFSRCRFEGPGLYAEGDLLYYQGDSGFAHAYSLDHVSLWGVHNKENMLAAIGAVEVCACEQDTIQQALEKFRGLEHRLEYVTEREGISFYNDSKATNIDALFKSLQSFPGRIFLIAGGREKGGDYGRLKGEIRKKVQMLVLIGEATEKFFALFGSLVPTCLASSLGEAVQICFENAQRGDVVLLSPGCASFDMFSNYEERGQKFKDLVYTLGGKRNTNKERAPSGFAGEQ